MADTFHAIYKTATGELFSEAEGDKNALVKLQPGQSVKSFPGPPANLWNPATLNYDIAKPGPTPSEVQRIALVVTLAQSSVPSDKALALILKALLRF